MFLSYKLFAPNGAQRTMIALQSDDSLARIAEIIGRGGVIAFRTDTFYGLGANPFDPTAIQQIKRLKGREDNKPILVLISDPEQVDRLIAEQSAAFKTLVGEFWPGPLTIVGTAVSHVPEELTASTKSLGVRLPRDQRVRKLVRACGGALTATSANRSGEPPARTATEVQTYFGDRVDLILDGADVDADAPSSVVDATTERVKLIREGLIPWADIQAALKQN